jgi:oligoendopeptidase F
MNTVTQLPHWNMTVVYPGLDSEEFEQGFSSALEAIGELGRLFDQNGIERVERLPVDESTIRTFESVVSALNGLLDQVHTLSAYVSSFVATNSRDELAQARWSELQQHLVRLSQLDTRFTAWIGSLAVEQLVERSEVARNNEYMLLKTKVEAEHLMSPAEESLAAELSLTGGSAWAKMHGNLTSQLLVTMESEEGNRDLPISIVRNMASDPDRATRRRAYEAELTAWERVAVPLAAALNGVKGESNTLTTRRGWSSGVDVALLNNNLDRRTLDAMLEAAHASLPDWRRYLRAKAQALGLSRLAWYDLFAPVGESERTWDFDEARDFIVRQFGAYSSRLSEFALRAFHEDWIDAEPRPGKRDGAFCMRLRGDESRILANFNPSYDAMGTLAHELGHAYHNLNLASRTPLQRDTPMTLAETASIFCQTIIRHAALEDANQTDQLVILEASLQDDCQVVVDVLSRFMFEQEVFDQRHHRELSVDELSELILDAQRRTYGDALDQSMLHPYMWSVKGHYYGPSRPYYNFPYMFGLLFGLGLYKLYEQDPEPFRAGYDDLLSRTGLSDAATLASHFGIDIRSPDFWHSSLDIERRDIERFERLVEAKYGKD